MIVLDAGVVIAILSADDTHHAAALDLIRSHLDDDLAINPINLAEALVRRAQTGQLQEAMEAIDAFGIVTATLPADAPRRLAEIRAATGSKMPDCCVLLTAEQANARVASFDSRLRRAAAERGLTVI